MNDDRDRRQKIVIAAVVLALSSFFLFFNLGHFALWDDEATTALFAQSVWRTGDALALLDHQVIAYDAGADLRGLYNRYMPPLQFYAAAPFAGIYPGSAFAARIPFAVCGLLTVGIMLLWLWRSGASFQTWVLVAVGILCNVSLMLFSRQCRYYALTMALAVILSFLYFYRDERPGSSIGIAVVSLLLLFSHYLCFVAVYACLTVDYLVWGRKNRAFPIVQLIIIILPPLLLGGLMVNALNPFLKTTGGLEKSAIVFQTLRDLNGSEMGVGVLLIFAPILALFRKGHVLRCFVAIVIYVTVIGLFSPSLSKIGTTVRYLTPLIPLCIVTGVFSIQALTKRFQHFAVPLAVLVFGTNLLHGGPWGFTAHQTPFSKILDQNRLRMTPLEFVAELISPPPSAYRITSEWIQNHLTKQESVWVMPSYATYPLMFHAPEPTYAWQLPEEAEPFEGLSAIHFMHRIPPDYVIAFGPYIENVRREFRVLAERGVHYAQIQQIDQYWYDLTRPELFWHSFDKIENYSRTSEAIYIFKRIQDGAVL